MTVTLMTLHLWRVNLWTDEGWIGALSHWTFRFSVRRALHESNNTLANYGTYNWIREHG